LPKESKKSAIIEDAEDDEKDEGGMFEGVAKELSKLDKAEKQAEEKTVKKVEK